MGRRAVVTGPFSYIGSAVARELRRRGWTIHALTNRRRPAGADDITVAPLRFDPEHLTRELERADALVSTYWIRLPHGGQDFGNAVANSRILIDAARRARVGRLVSVSVSNADAGSSLGYYRGKAHVDEAVRAAGLPCAIVRPTLVVGPADVLTSNIAWFLRRFPLFPVPDGGRYRVQPITLADTGRVIADAVEAPGDVEVDAAGPEILSFRDYVRTVARACGVRRLVVGAPAWLSLLALRLLAPLLHDVVLTREEIEGLAQEKLVSREAPRGTESVTDWLLAHGAGLGRRYVNDRDRHFGRGAGEPILTPGV
jgi:NADH dehydrogenase